MRKAIKFINYYFTHKYRCVPWYRIILKIYGSIVLAASLLFICSDSPIYIVLCCLISAAGFIAYNLFVLAGDFICWLAYEFLKETYDTEKRKARYKRNAAKYLEAKRRSEVEIYK